MQDAKMQEQDKEWMQKCLDLAALAEGRTAPNPMVGAVVLDAENNFCAQGFHKKAGSPHAEIVALQEAGERAKGGTLYINLEPCGHHGRTPPCVDKIISSGIKRVVIAMLDPNPVVVASRSLIRLHEAGIEVEQGILESESKFLNRGFVKNIKTGLPWLALKLAVTLDGRIADRGGNSRWISGDESQKFVHGLRNKFDCVLIGAKTALQDKSKLTCRGIAGGRDPRRAVVDPHRILGINEPICLHEEGSDNWTVIFSAAQNMNEYASNKVNSKSLRVIEIDSNNVSAEQNNSLEKIEPEILTLDLSKALSWLAKEGILTVLCEGGGRLASALLSDNLVDEIFWIIAPKIINDNDSIYSLPGRQAIQINECLKLKNSSIKQLGEDYLIHAVLNKDY